MNYLESLPGLVRGIAEYKALGAALDPILEGFWQKLSAFPEDVLPGKAEGELLERWERMTSLLPDGTVSQRRFRLLSRLGSLRPYTPEQLRRQLSAAFGREDGFVIDVDPDAFTLSVEVDEAGAEVLSALTSELRRMIPANLILRTSVGSSETVGLYAGAALQISSVLRLG